LRDCVKSKKILGCGVPLGSSFGMVDYCRIGGDVALKWEDRLLSFMRYRERVDTRHSLESTVGRRHLSGNAFMNDPDVVILRDENNSLTPEEKSTLFQLNNLFGGLVFTSDNVATYSDATMRLYRAMFPLREKKMRSVIVEDGLCTARFSIGDLDYVAYANLSDDERSFTLEKGVLFRGDPAADTGRFVIGGGDYSLGPHDTHCFLLLPAKAPSIAGSTGHIFPGSEVSSFKAAGKKFIVKLHAGARRPLDIMIRVAKPGSYTINGSRVATETVLPETHIVRATIR
nr:alpha-galactosidase [Spirochaetota bacterium]